LTTKFTAPFSVAKVFGVDFSGAARSGQIAWLAETRVDASRERLRLVSLNPLGRLAGDDERSAVNQFLATAILASSAAIWGMDFPFGLPVELGLGNWTNQLRYLARDVGGAKQMGRSLVKLAQDAGHTMHVRRTTDRETQTPFDCYHYRIIYQTYLGMREVLAPIARDMTTCVLPFQYRKMKQASRLVVEACPSSTLKRLRLPHRLYKQSAGKTPTPAQVVVRSMILNSLTSAKTGFIDVSASFRRTMLHDPGGDALDAVIAAVGSYHGLRTADHDAIRRDNRYPREGRVFC